jgi:PEP-CTERM motif
MKLTGSLMTFGLLLGSIVCPYAHAETVKFDFENQTATFISPPALGRPGALTSLTLTNSGWTLTVLRQGRIPFDIVSNTGNQAGKPAGWAIKSLDPFIEPTAPWIFNLSLPATAFSLELGDYGEDVDTWTLQAFSGANGTGSLLASATGNYGLQAFPTINIPSVNSAAILSLMLIGGSDAAGFPDSVFLDNIQVTAPSLVPEPSTFLLLATVLFGTMLRKRVMN